MSKLPVRVRWLLRSDMFPVSMIEHASFEFPWFHEDFLQCLRQRNCIGMIAESLPQLQTVGFMIYELARGRLDLLNFAVDPDFRRMGVGSQMVARLVDKLSQQQRTEISVTVREISVDAQLFFRNQGFRVVDQIPGYYEETDEDGYLFLYRLRASHHRHSVG